TNAQCDTCHSPGNWQTSGFNHENSAGRCSTCHNGVTATGQGSRHFVTTAQCDSCHTTTRWSSRLTFRHTTSSYPGDHRGGLACRDCHISNSEQIPWRFPAYQPDCAACHANDYNASEHQKTPNTNYSVSELRDCSGACHEYNANGTIRKQRFGEHRVSDNDFD
ncbi:MAG: cytochrome c3 family protein, partial [Gammaproteobacteria bacterium]|nr:cytochrome c3 family protein [Gammaproteobacteria bacterium]